MISVAILGAGIGAQHLDAYRKLPNHFTVKYLIDRDLGRADALRHEKDITLSEELTTALKDPAIDVVDICLPPHLHVSVALDALDAGKHVICEKPISTSLADAEQLKAATRTSGKSVFPVFQYRWGTSTAQLSHLIDAGLAGRPTVAALETHWARGAEYYSVPWRGTWVGELGGAILGHAIHSHDLLCHFMGPVAAVSAAASTRVNPIETEDCAAILFEMQNGALATSSITLGAATDETRLRFVFEHLTVTSKRNPYAPASEPWVFAARNSDRQAEIDASLQSCTSQKVGFEGFLKDVAASLAGRDNGAVTLDDGIRSIALVTAIYAAARSGQRVTLPIHPSHPLYEGWQP